MKAMVIAVAAILFGYLLCFGGWSEPVPVDSINTSDMHDFYPSISADGNFMYLTNGNNLAVAHWTGATWSTPVDLGPNINSGQRQVKATVTPDNRTLYFTSYKDGGYGSYDIWKSDWDDSCQCWGEAAVMPPPTNTEYMEWDVQLSHDGRKMYLSSNRHFSWGDLDIWCSDWNDSTQSWEEPQNLGMEVNSSTRDYGAYPSLDGTRLYFASWGPHHFEPPQWLGPVDLFVATNHGGVWDSIDILPPPIMTGYWEESPCITDDGTTLYFASTRPGGPGWTDIYISLYTTNTYQDDDNRDTKKIDLNIFPNPTNDATRFTLLGDNSVKVQVISIFDLSGRGVSSLNLSGSNSVIWDLRGSDGKKLSSGIYFALAKTATDCIAKKVILLK